MSAIYRPIDILNNLARGGISRPQYIKQSLCTKCQNAVNKEHLSGLVLAEFNISGWCGSCQSGFFRCEKQEPLKSEKHKKQTPNAPNTPNAHKIYINVAYIQKEEAKKMKAQWDPLEKSWFTWSTNKNNDQVFATYLKRDQMPEIEARRQPDVPEVIEAVPEGYVLHNGRFRKERFFCPYSGNEV